jgi:hypothetical protein
VTCARTSVIHNWSRLTRSIAELKYRICTNPENSFCLRNDSNYVDTRKAFGRLNSVISAGKNIPNDITVETLNKNFIDAHQKLSKNQDIDGKMCFNGRINCLIPSGGFVDNNVQRLLLITGSEKHLNNVPMAIFIEQV